MRNFEDKRPSKAQIAYEKNEFYEFITGRNGYSVPVIDAQVDVPTDWTRTIPGIYDLYNETKDDKIIEAFQDAIRKAINGSCIDIWCACNTLFFHCDHEEDGKTPFIIDKSLRRELRSIVIEKTELLRNTYYGYNKGKSHVYNDILRLNNNFYDYHGCQLLE